MRWPRQVASPHNAKILGAFAPAAGTQNPRPRPSCPAGAAGKAWSLSGSSLSSPSSEFTALQAHRLESGGSVMLFEYPWKGGQLELWCGDCVVVRVGSGGAWEGYPSKHRGYPVLHYLKRAALTPA